MDTFILILKAFLCIGLGAIGGKIGLKYLMFLITALVMFTAMIWGSVLFTDPVARLFSPWIVQSVSRTIVIAGIVASTLFCGIHVSRWIERLLAGITVQANTALGAGMGCATGLISILHFM